MIGNRVAGALGAALACVLAAGTVHAADTPSASDQALAQSLFDDAVTSMERGDYAAACPKLAESQRLDPGGGTLLNLGLCREKEGKLASAWVAYNESLSQAIKDRRTEREATARARIAEIEGKLAKFVVHVQAATRALAGLEIRLDGTPIRDVAWETPTPIDRGRHELSATAPGKQRWSTVLEVTRDGEAIEATVPVLVDALAAPPKRDAGGAVPAQLLAGWVAIGIGSASVGTGIVTGILAFDRRAKSDDECPAERCTQRGVDLNEQAKTYAWISNVTFGVGLAAAGIGVALVLTAPKRASAIHVVPTVGPGVAGLSASGTF